MRHRLLLPCDDALLVRDMLRGSWSSSSRPLFGVRRFKARTIRLGIAPGLSEREDVRAPWENEEWRLNPSATASATLDPEN